MRISINLASKPFIELRPLFARLRLIMGALTVLALALGLGVHALSVKAKQAGAEMDLLKAQTLRVQQQTAANEARMRRPENQDVLHRTQFLNTLFAQKSFSWTSVMMDLEHVLPQGVQVTSIDPAVSKDGVVTIRLRVTGQREKAIQLVRNLERSDRFVAPRLAGETALTADKAKAFGAVGRPAMQNVNAVLDDWGSGVEFEIGSGYNALEQEIRDEGAAVREERMEREEERAKSRAERLSATGFASPSVTKPKSKPMMGGAR